MKVITSIVLFCMLFSWSAMGQQVVRKTDSLVLNSFKKVPSDIDGCSCYFFASAKDQNAGNYLLFNDYANTAYVKLNGRIRKFILQSHNKNKNLFVYKNGPYLLKVNFSRLRKSGYEGSELKGTITLIESRHVLQRSFVGSCGC